MAGFVRVAGWRRFDWLRAGFSTRAGGESLVYGPGGEQNLGWTAEDDATVVARNRMGLIEAVGGDAAFELVTTKQVHGMVVQRAARGGGPLSTQDGRAMLQGDGLMTSESGLMLGVQTADCVPVLIVDTKLRAVTAIHAGWRGTVAGIVREGIAGMRHEFGSRVEDLVAAVGPSIGACCFEVGPEVVTAFGSAFGYARELIREEEGERLRVDLWEANRRQLMDAGVAAESIEAVGDCTVCSRTVEGRRKYFSHRAEKGVTGRMLSVVGVAGSRNRD